MYSKGERNRQQLVAPNLGGGGDQQHATQVGDASCRERKRFAPRELPRPRTRMAATNQSHVSSRATVTATTRFTVPPNALKSPANAGRRRASEFSDISHPETPIAFRLSGSAGGGLKSVQRIWGALANRGSHSTIGIDPGKQGSRTRELILKARKARKRVPEVEPLGLKDYLLIAVSLVGSSLLMAAATGPQGQPLAAWFALFPLFVAIAVLKPWQAGLAGALWGAGVYFFAVSGLFFSSHSGTSPGSWTFLWLTLIPCAYALLAAGLTQMIGFNSVVFCVGWVAAEILILRFNLDFGFAGLTLQSDSIFYWIAQAFGSVVVCFIVAYVNAAYVTVVAQLCLMPPRCAFFLPSRESLVVRDSQIALLVRSSFIAISGPRAPPHARGLNW